MRTSGLGRLRRGIAALVLVTLLGGCEYWDMAVERAPGSPVPWFCNPVAPNSVTGPGMGTTNWYAGQTRAPLSDMDCAALGSQLDQAKAYANQFPTLGAAEAAGFARGFAFIPGMGTHHANRGITAAMLQDPSFNRFDPVIPGSVLDGIFDPRTPEFLQYNGNTPGSVLIGMSWYVRTTNGLPPAGFAGSDDWWHHHPTLCLSNTNAEVVGVNTTDAECTPRNGTNVHMGNYYMLHTWQVDDLEYHGDLFAPMHPCILSTGAIFDMNDPCHTSAMGGSNRATNGAAASAAPGFCQLDLINDQWDTPRRPTS
jgi:hypothetical protein